MKHRLGSVYVATRSDRALIARAVMDALELRGWTVDFDWTRFLPPHGDLAGTIPVGAIALRELQAIRDADFVVILLPGGRGTHVELGAALALLKPVVIHAEDPQLFHEEAGLLPHYAHPLVRIAQRSSDIPDMLEWAFAQSVASATV